MKYPVYNYKFTSFLNMDISYLNLVFKPEILT